MLLVTLTAEDGGVWTLRGFTEGQRELKFGPNEKRQLPEPIGPSISVQAQAFSICGTVSPQERITIRRF